MEESGRNGVKEVSDDDGVMEEVTWVMIDCERAALVPLEPQRKITRLHAVRENSRRP